MNAYQSHIVLVDDETPLLQATTFILKAAGFGRVTAIDDPRRVMESLANEEAQLLILDLSMPHISGLELLPKIRERYPLMAIIVMTAIMELETAVECMKKGADDYLTKPMERQHLLEAVDKALEKHALRAKVSDLSDRLVSGRLDHPEAFDRIVTKSPKMARIFQYLESVSRSKEPVLIHGETGTGKELAAEALHTLMGSELPMVVENVAGLDDALFADALFGHVKGAFSGADSDRQGLAAKAGAGVLVLDEIGDLSAHSQIKLLRLIQERRFTPIGSDEPKELKARIVVTT
ncbi:MAG: sigma-54-dependent Fis family transcriptional regulator, partial [Magnetococcales bacterium]|nr:sigma-54-dependent Fis family transcriptional regulator [Magnetococcales bacterium]